LDNIINVELWSADVDDVVHDDLKIAEFQEPTSMIKERVYSKISLESENS